MRIRWLVPLSIFVFACSAKREGSSFDVGLQPLAAWPMYRQGVDHSGRSFNKGPSAPTVRWHQNPSGGATSGLSEYCPPSIAADGTLYVASAQGAVFALNPQGALKWQATARGHCDGSPAIAADGTVIVAMGDLLALGADGVVRWSFTPPADEMAGSPAIGSDGTIYVSTEGSEVYAFKPDGTVKWLFPISKGGKSSPAIGSDGTIYVGGDSKLYALSPSGTEKWEAAIPDSEHLSPTVDADGNIAALVRDLLIFSPGGAPLTTIVAGAAGTQFPAASTADGGWAISTMGLTTFHPDGTPSWKADPTAQRDASVPIVDVDGNVYVSDSSCNVSAYDPEGNRRWSVAASIGGAGCGAPVLGADRTLYLTSAGAGIIAVGD
jgi:outer membrane protein assembly factor BamB